jgi:hypothetical protein
MGASIRYALAAVAILAGALGLWALWPVSAPPSLIAGLTDDGLRGAPCPARTLLEQDARKKQGVRPPSQLGERLRRQFPLGSDAALLAAELAQENFTLFTPCPNDPGVLGARWLSRDWSHPDALVYWRVDDLGRLTFVDGHVSRAN